MIVRERGYKGKISISSLVEAMLRSLGKRHNDSKAAGNTGRGGKNFRYFIFTKFRAFKKAHAALTDV
ncbi:MAG: hypothetical protein M3342_14105, partial [Bacteroidota bacterium]|nr:hypothetical protein [Bacteroidota bacterium]